MRRSRRAFTLLELMIVLVIMVAVMSVAWPRITGQIQRVAPREAALQVKSDLAETRDRAVTAGEPWAFRILRGTAKYEIGPVSEFRTREESLLTTSPMGGLGDLLETSLESSVPTASPIPDSTSLQSSVVSKTEIEELELPAGMVFDDGWAHSTQDANQMRVDPQLQSIQLQQPTIPVDPIALPSQWKYVVIFQPDGRATDAELRLKDQASEAKIRLRVRGLTGGVMVDGVERKRPVTELLQDPTLTNVEGIPGIDATTTTGAGQVPGMPTTNSVNPSAPFEQQRLPTSQGTAPYQGAR